MIPSGHSQYFPMQFCSRFFLILLLTISFHYGFGQSDTIFFHNGKTAIGKIISVSGYTISYQYKDEVTEQLVGKYAVSNIHYRSGRNEWISDKITITGENDWKKVIVLEDKSQDAGLVRVSNIRANTKFINLHTANSGEERVSEMLLREAAKQQCPFILITYERETVYNGLIKSWGAIQEIKKAISYHYQ